MTEAEKLEKKLDNAKKSEKSSKSDDLISKIWEISLVTMILTGFILLIFIIPIVLFYVWIGDLFVGYDRIYLNYIYPVFEFLKKDAPLIGIVCLIGVIVGYLIIFYALISMIIRKQTPSENKILMIIGCICLIIIYCVLYGFANNKLSSKETLASVKLTSVEKLIATLTSKTHDFGRTNDNLTEEIKRSTETVRLIQSNKGYRSDAEAEKDQEIFNELQAIQKAHTYKKFIYDDWTQTLANIIKMRGDKKQLELNIIVLTGINEEQLGALIREIDDTLKNIGSTAGELVINKDTKQIPMEEIWKQYIHPAQPN